MEGVRKALKGVRKTKEKAPFDSKNLILFLSLARSANPSLGGQSFPKGITLRATLLEWQWWG